MLFGRPEKFPGLASQYLECFLGLYLRSYQDQQSQFNLLLFVLRR